jgi:hypothetical protein
MGLFGMCDDQVMTDCKHMRGMKHMAQWWWLGLWVAAEQLMGHGQEADGRQLKGGCAAARTFV